MSEQATAIAYKGDKDTALYLYRLPSGGFMLMKQTYTGQMLTPEEAKKWLAAMTPITEEAKA